MAARSCKRAADGPTGSALPSGAEQGPTLAPTAGEEHGHAKAALTAGAQQRHTLAALKNMCRARGLPVSGIKEDLVQRLARAEAGPASKHARIANAESSALRIPSIPSAPPSAALDRTAQRAKTTGSAPAARSAAALDCTAQRAKAMGSAPALDCTAQRTKTTGSASTARSAAATPPGAAGPGTALAASDLAGADGITALLRKTSEQAIRKRLRAHMDVLKKQVEEDWRDECQKQSETMLDYLSAHQSILVRIAKLRDKAKAAATPKEATALFKRCLHALTAIEFLRLETKSVGGARIGIVDFAKEGPASCYFRLGGLARLSFDEVRGYSWRRLMCAAASRDDVSDDIILWMIKAANDFAIKYLYPVGQEPKRWFPQPEDQWLGDRQLSDAALRPRLPALTARRTELQGIMRVLALAAKTATLARLPALYDRRDPHSPPPRVRLQYCCGDDDVYVSSTMCDCSVRCGCHRGSDEEDAEDEEDATRTANGGHSDEDDDI
eukprot:m.213909 g.213909  ORF g.213909 m.213909 type:complete len:498 (-) comp10143_c1_seq1:52-1545(-)